VREIDARLGASSAQGEVGWSRESDALRGMVEASLAIDDFAGLSTAIPARLPLDGRVGVSASLSGTLAHARATIAATSSGLDVAGQHIDRAAVGVSADLERSRFVIDQLTLSSGNGRLDGRGDIDLTRNTYTAHVTASDLPVTPLVGIADSDVLVSGRVNGSFDGEGSFSNLGGRGRLSLNAARWKDADLGNPTADVTLEGRNAVVAVDAPELALKGNGSIGVDSRGTLAVRGDWTPNDVAAIQQRLAVAPSTPISGSAALRFELNGTRDHLDELRGLVNLDALDVRVGGQAIRLARPGPLEYDGRTARAGNIGFATGSSTLVLDGSIGDQAARGLTASLDGMLADFGFVRDLVRPRASDAAPLPPPAGSIQLRLTATGAIARPALTGTFQVADGRVPLTAEQGVTGISISGKYDAGVLTLDRADAAFEGARLTATARVPSNVFIDRLPAFLRRRIVPADGPASLSAQLLSVTQAVAAPFVDPATLDQLGGRIDATVQLEADRVALERVRGAVTLDRAELRLGGTELDQQTTTRVSIREGRVTVDAWEWGRGDNRLAVRGGATLGANSTLNLAATSVLDLRVLNILTPSTRVVGRADAEIRLGGTVRAPTLDGWVTVSNGEARVANPRLIVSDITGTVTLAADTITVERVFAHLNGGESEIAGTISHRWFTPLGGRITMVSNSAALAIEGLRAEANLNVALEAEPGRPVVSGTVTLVRSAFRERLSLTSGLLKALQAPSTTSIPAPPSVLDRLRLDVRIVTESDLLVDNNYGKLSATADLRLVGTASRPSITGRTTLGEGGTIFFGTRRYRLQEGGSIDFANPNRIEPDLNITATTNVQGSEIQLTLTGTPATLTPKLVAPNNPEYSESDMVSLLLTGQTASNATSGGISSGGTELLGLLSGEFLNTAGQAVGLSTVRVESGSPDLRFDAGLVATETDPGTRLTIGKNIGSRFEVVFSQSLQQSGGLTWIVSYSPKSNLVLRAVNQDNGDRVYDFRHDLTFGRPANFKRPVQRPRETVIRVQISGAGADENALRSQLKVKEGDRFSFFRWQDDRERIENFFHEREHFEARVVTRRTPEPADATMINLSYDIRPGPRTTVQVQGFVLPASAVREIEQAWASTVVDDLLQEEIVPIVRAALVDAGYVQASVTTRLQNAADEKRLSILVETGTHASDKEVRFTGNKGEATKQLQAVLAEPRLQRAIWIAPDAARDALVAFYRTNGYLKATVRLDPITRSGGTVIRPIQVDEGEAFRIQEIRVDGGASLSPADIIAKAGLAKGEVITDATMEGARVALDQSYRALGFNSVGVTIQSGTTSPRPEVNIVVHVDEGRQQRLRDIVTMGVEHTRPSLVSRALNLDIGEPANLAAWNEARRRLYETGAFRSVDIEREVIEEPAGETAAPAPLPAEPVRALVNVQEWPRYRFRYGLELNDTAQSGDPSEVLPSFQEGGRSFSLGATSDFAARNLFGRALTAGIAARYTLDFRAVRTYATMPTFLGRHIVTNLWVERSHEGSGVTATGIEPAFATDATTFTFEQRIRPRRKLEVWYGYTIERNHTFDLHPPPVPGNQLPFDIEVTKANLTSGVILDRRNDVFDATGGWFHATSVEYAPGWISPDLRLARLLTQQKYFRRAGKVVFASWAQVGLATAFDQTLLTSDRFFAGGGNSVRGYAEQVISPVDFLGTIVGGNALIVLNQEVRFPMFKYVRGVGFIDAGRAFETVGQMSLKDLAVGTGIGFRIDTPVVLLRVDMGIPLDNAYGPRKPRWFFSIGQMF
jgi:outer membrane protein assembly factor BamA/autotransporter translocation and assembly factor TamB